MVDIKSMKLTIDAFSTCPFCHNPEQNKVTTEGSYSGTGYLYAIGTCECQFCKKEYQVMAFSETEIYKMSLFPDEIQYHRNSSEWREHLKKIVEKDKKVAKLFQKSKEGQWR